MAYPWEKPIKSREELRPLVRSFGLQAHICWWIGAVFAVLGIVAGAMSTSLGLNSTGWLLLALVTFVAGIPFMIGVGMGWYLKIAGGRKKD